VERRSGARPPVHPGGVPLSLSTRRRHRCQGHNRSYRSPFTDAHAYYATSAHEHAHWTGHASRLNRDLANRFGDDAYAAEELVAELYAAFTCATLGISTTPRPDHAAYLAHWLHVLRSDPRALFTVASKAQAATDHLCTLAGEPSNEADCAHRDER
jgi:antirestriction protein ArdC